MKEVGRFLVRLEKDRERIFKKRKKRKFRFSRKEKFQFRPLKEIFLKEKRSDREKISLYEYPLVEGVGYTYDKTRYYLKTGLKKNLIINEDLISVYNREGQDWLNVKFSYLKRNIGYLFRNKWYVGARRYRKVLSKRKRFEKWVYNMHFRLRKKEKDFPLMRVLKRGIPLQVGRFHSRVPYTKEFFYSSVIYFLKERFLREYHEKELRLTPRTILPESKEGVSHQIELVHERKRLEKRIRWNRKKLRRKKKGLVLWDRPLGLITFKKEGLVKREDAPVRSVYIHESV